MSRYVLAGLAAIGLACEVVAQDSAGVSTRTAILPEMGTFTISDERAACAKGHWDRTVARVAEDNPEDAASLPDAASHCPAVLTEIARRGRLRDLYALSTRKDGLISTDGGEEHTRILKAALSGAERYESVVGGIRSINCELAFDAGFYYGVSFPDEPAASGTSEEAIDRITDQCFREQNVSPRHAAIAGMRTGQRIAPDL